MGDRGLPTYFTGLRVDDLFLPVRCNRAELRIREHDIHVGRMRMHAGATNILAAIGMIFDDACPVVFKHDGGCFWNARVCGRLRKDAGHDETEAREDE